MIRWATPLVLVAGIGGCSVLLPLDDRSRRDGPGVIEATTGHEGGTSDLRAEGSVTHDGIGDAVSGEATGDGGPDAAVDCLVTKKCATGWCKLDTGTGAALHDLHGTDLTDLWAVGASGTVLTFERQLCTWTPGPPLPTGSTTNPTLHAITGDGTTMFLGGTGGTLLELVGGTWNPSLTSGPAPTTVRALAVTGSKGVYGAGGDSPTVGFIVKRSSAVWSPVSLVSNPRFHALSSGSSTVFAGGVGELLQLDLTNESAGFQDVAACALTTDQQINGLWSPAVSQPVAVVAVGHDYQKKQGFFLSYIPPSTCNQLPTAGQPAWSDVDGSSPSDLWLAGEGGWVAQWKAGGLQKEQPTTVNLDAVWVNPTGTPKLVMVAGEKGEVWARFY